MSTANNGDRVTQFIFRATEACVMHLRKELDGMRRECMEAFDAGLSPMRRHRLNEKSL